ncbi:MAG: hypothetical protein ACJAU6_003510 [Alphaproteobacteria bacterium]
MFFDRWPISYILDAPGDQRVTFILLSYARPQNLSRITAAIQKSRFCDRIILCNNNPEIDVLNYIDPSSRALEIIQQTEKWVAIKRFCIAKECASEYFVCIDDDLFLTPVQIDALVNALLADPAVPHGVWGENIYIDTDADGVATIRLESGLHNFSGDVRVINRAYAFTQTHVQQLFHLMAALGVNDPRMLGPADDILLSFSGDRPPKCHDLGPLDNCPTSSEEGIALWKEKGFFDKRIQKLLQLRQLLSAP